MNEDRVLFILRGLPGSGKTTAAEHLADREDFDPYVVATADDYFMTNEGVYNFEASKLDLAHKSCQMKVENAMKNGDYKVFVANTSTTEKELNDYYKLADKYDYMVVSLIVENRHGGKNVHGVPEVAMKRMLERFNVKLV